MSDIKNQDHEVVRPGMRKDFQRIDREVWLWSLGKKLTKRQVQEHAIATFEKAGITTFKASDGWYRRWLARWGKRKETDQNSIVATLEKTDSHERLYNDLLEQLIDDTPTTSQHFGNTIFCEEDCSSSKFKCLEVHESDCPIEDLGNELMKEIETQDLAETSGLSDLITSKSVLAPKKKIERYLPQFKTKVVSHALNHSIKDAAYAFKVNKSTIADWIREDNEHSEKVDGDTQIEVRPDLDFVEWLQRERKSGRLITKDLLLNKFKELTSSRDVVTKKAQWFYKYVDRFAEGDSYISKTHIMYPVDFKRELAKLCGKWSKKTIGRVFNIDRKRISSWAERYFKDAPKQLERQVSSYLTDDKIDGHVWKWYVETKPKPSSKQIREKAVKLYRRAGYNGISCSSGWYYRWRKRYMLPSSTAEKKEFDEQLVLWVLAQFDDNKSVSHAQLVAQARAMKGVGVKLSSSWVVRFLKRYSYLMQKSPGYHVKLPGALEAKISEFQNQLLNTIVRDGICLANVLAFDEVPLNFSTTGSHQPKHLLRKSGFDNCHASLILTCSADGTLHPTTIILKSQDDEEDADEMGSSSVDVQYQPQGTADSTVLNRWFQEMLGNHEGPCICICDGYSPHKELRNIETMFRRGSTLMLIPDGCSSRLLPITFGLSEEFKKVLAFHWEKWLHRNSWGTSNGVQLPLHRDIIDWVSIAHEKCFEEMKDSIKEDFSKILNHGLNLADLEMQYDASADFASNAKNAAREITVTALDVLTSMSGTRHLFEAAFRHKLTKYDFPELKSAIAVLTEADQAGVHFVPAVLTWRGVWAKESVKLLQRMGCLTLSWTGHLSGQSMDVIASGCHLDLVSTRSEGPTRALTRSVVGYLPIHLLKNDLCSFVGGLLN